MNIQKLISSLYVLSAISFNIGCKPYKVKEIPIVGIIDAIEVNKNYVFSEEAKFSFMGKYYSARRRIEYNKSGELVKLIVYYPDGTMVYNKTELLADTALIKLFNFPMKQDWVYMQDKGILKDGYLFSIGDLNDTVFTIKDEPQRFFYFNNPDR
jgi:hypothetical protein